MATVDFKASSVSKPADVVPVVDGSCGGMQAEMEALKDRMTAAAKSHYVVPGKRFGFLE